MFESRVDAAIAATLAMLLEVSGTPKAGNVDRDHDFSDLRYEHFLASASSAFPVFLEGGGIGESILKAVRNSMRWHRAQNVHFGAFLLIIPLLRVWDARNAESAGEKATLELTKTTFEDSLSLYEAFKISRARVMDVGELNLRADDTRKRIVEERINLYEWMRLAPEENVIAKELVGNFKFSVSSSGFILEKFEEKGDINYSIVLAYHKLLSEVRDPLVISKFGSEVAEEVRRRAGETLNSLSGDVKNDIQMLKKFDGELIERGINPGSVADLTISSLYLALLDGLRF